MAGSPHILINSLDVDKGLAMLDAGRLDDLADYLAAGVASLENAGADFGFIAANTPHIVFEERAAAVCDSAAQHCEGDG